MVSSQNALLSRRHGAMVASCKTSALYRGDS